VEPLGKKPFLDCSFSTRRESVTEQQVLAYLNETPYYYTSLGAGRTFKERVGEVEIFIRRDTKEGGIIVECDGEGFHLYWDQNSQSWEQSKPLKFKSFAGLGRPM